jgi:hypothetical protein
MENELIVYWQVEDFIIEIRTNKYTGYEISISNNGYQFSTISVKSLEHFEMLVNAMIEAQEKLGG